jgi:hypothetical protein
MPPDSASGARFAHKAHTPRRNPAPRSTEFPASANLPPSPAQTPPANVADPNPHSAELKFPCARRLVAPRSKTSAHDPHATAPWAKAPAARDTSPQNSEKEAIHRACSHSSAASRESSAGVLPAVPRASRPGRGERHSHRVLLSCLTPRRVALHTPCPARHTASRMNDS